MEKWSNIFVFLFHVIHLLVSVSFQFPKAFMPGINSVNDSLGLPASQHILKYLSFFSLKKCISFIIFSCSYWMINWGIWNFPKFELRKNQVQWGSTKQEVVRSPGPAGARGEAWRADSKAIIDQLQLRAQVAVSERLNLVFWFSDLERLWT